MDFVFGRGNRFFEFATKIAQLMWLNILMILCCIPVITIGGAFTAMHHVLLQIYRDEETSISRAFFSSFAKNFRRSTLVWLIYLAFYAVLAVDYIAMMNLEKYSLGYLKLLVPVLVFVGTLSVCWVFVLQSRYNLTVKDTIEFGFTRIIAFPVRTLFMGLSLIAPIAFVIYLPRFAILALFLGVSGPGILRTCFYNHALEVMEEKPDEPEEEAQI